jgi:ATP-binding cassette, subfamily B, bacterial MsbA
VSQPAVVDSGLQIYRRLLTYAWAYKWLLLVAAVAMAITSATEAGFAWIMKPLIDQGFVHRDPTSIYTIPLGMVGIVLVRGISGYLANISMNHVGRNVIFHLRNDMFARMVRLPSRFFDENSSGALISKVIFDVEQVMNATTKALSSLVKDTLSLIALMGLLFWHSWKLTIVLLLMAPVLALSIRLISRRFRKSSRLIQQSMGDITHVVQEATEGQRVVKTFCAQDTEARVFAEVNARNQNQALKKAKTAALNVPVVELFATIGVAIAIVLAMHEANIGQMGAGTFVSAITAMMLMMPAIKRLTQVNEVVQTGIAAAGSVFALMDEAPELDAGTDEIARVVGRVEYRRVGFGYPTTSAPALHNVSFVIEPGQTVALVGASGSGKTTAANLLPRFYAVDEGAVLLDGININDLRLNNLRSHIALVSQETVLFDDTIGNNIAYGADENVDETRLFEAARAAFVMDFVERLPDGLNTMVGERGVRLSGGQRQRIAIARALYKNAPILILDEATSSLDAESERYVQAAMQKLMENRTTLVIAHRLSTIENAHRIVVLDRGRVMETGTHQELLERNGVYARLYRIQFSEPGA